MQQSISIRDCHIYCFAPATHPICGHAGHAGGQSLFITVITKHYVHVHAQQICSTMAIKSGCVNVWKVIMTVEATDLKQSGRCYETINLLCAALNVTWETGSWFGQHYYCQ